MEEEKKDELVRYRVKVVCEANQIVEFDVKKNAKMSYEKIYELARIKALLNNNNEWRIGDELRQEIIGNTIVNDGEPIDYLVAYMDDEENVEDNNHEALVEANNDEDFDYVEAEG